MLSIPFNPGLYSLLKDHPHRMAEKPALRDTPGTPTEQPEATYCYFSNSPTVASLLVGTLHSPSVPGHIDMGTRLARLGK